MAVLALTFGVSHKLAQIRCKYDSVMMISTTLKSQKCTMGSDDQAHQPVSKRINLTLPDAVYAALERWADVEGRPTANLAAFLVEVAVKEAEKENKIPPPPRRNEGK